MTKARKK